MPIPPAPAPLVNDESTTYAKEDEDFGQVFSKKKKAVKPGKSVDIRLKALLINFEIVNL